MIGALITAALLGCGSPPLAPPEARDADAVLDAARRSPADALLGRWSYLPTAAERALRAVALGDPLPEGADDDLRAVAAWARREPPPVGLDDWRQAVLRGTDGTLTVEPTTWTYADGQTRHTVGWNVVSVLDDGAPPALELETAPPDGQAPQRMQIVWEDADHLVLVHPSPQGEDRLRFERVGR